ncbi:hypothetical protein LUZ60_006481 [Juncus effusus]|nr:hypothetical protein LUZ60_006481 [Juncus effusus]
MGKKAGDLVEDDFRVSGPVHLEVIDWEKPDHQCAVMACLVQATYVLESDRNRAQSEPLAPAWWQSFNFELIETMVDPKDSYIFGAVYRYNKYNPKKTPQAPRFVIAFRGTMLEGGNLTRDLSHDLLIGDGGLGSTSRLKTALEYIDRHMAQFGSEGIFLAGHSLGSSMAMLVGANLATKGVHCKTFLFNLPSCITEEKSSRRLIARFLQITPLVLGMAGAIGIFPIASVATLGMAASVIMIDTLVVVSGIATVTSLAALIGSFVLSVQKRIKETNVSLYSPHIYTNPEDPICKNWISYFRKQKVDKKRGPFELAGFVESGVLKINSTVGRGMMQAHGLKQWWQQGVKLQHLEEYSVR